MMFSFEQTMKAVGFFLLGTFVLINDARAGDLSSEFCKETGKDGKVTLESGLNAATFNVSLMKRIAATHTGNFVASPFSIRTTLAMLLAGAKGETAKEIARVTGLPAVTTPTEQAALRAMTSLFDCRDEGQTQASLASRVYLAKGKHVNSTYAQTLKSIFNVSYGEIDYLHKAEAGRHEINAWVEQVTAGKIKDLIPRSGIDRDTRMTLVNALYLKGRWQVPFPAHGTKPRDFHISARASVKTSMMQVGPEHLDYAALKDFRVVSMPFSDGFASMAVFVPNEIDGLKTLESSMTGESLRSALAALKSQRLILSFPKFKIDSTISVKDDLSALGIKRAFVRKEADFSGIDGGKDQLYISSVAHKAFIDVQETGLEAAAATAITMGFGSAPRLEKPIEVKVDRPFFFVVYEPTEHTPLFIGHVTRPLKAK